MGLFATLLIIMLVVMADVILFDKDRKRWGWMKGWTNGQKALFFASFIAVSFIIYFVISAKYI
ncbi:hypothetical protein [Bacillus massiliigorillae]|uniref:hypothetical protein n=1 Tax=Bacillus massiliigorillae TaxID=1243664 RepID=UPI0003AAB7ED|nr:hypothetical protein [Bacillus massiliigorillae]